MSKKITIEISREGLILPDGTPRWYTYKRPTRMGRGMGRTVHPDYLETRNTDLPVVEKTKTVGAIITNATGAGKVLLVKRKDNENFMPSVWEIPGGGVDDGETLQQAVEREVQEETGLQLSATGYSVVSTCTYGDTVQYNYHLPLCVSNPWIELTEHSEYAWVSISDLGQYFPPGDMILTCLMEWAGTL